MSKVPMLVCVVVVGVLGFTARADAEDHHKALFKFLEGEWDYEITPIDSKGTVTWKVVADGNALQGRFVERDGIVSVELGGWRSDTKTMVAHGYGATGNYWHLNFKKITANTIEGPNNGVLPDGRTYSGMFTGRKIDDDHYEWRFNGKTGDGKELSMTGTYTRKPQTPSTAGKDRGSVPQKVLKQLDFMVGNWNEISDPANPGGPERVLSHKREWAPGKHCLIVTWSGIFDGVKVDSTGIVGYSRTTNDVTERWYVSDGTYFETRYPVDKMGDRIWEGTTSWVEPDDRKVEGPCRLEKMSNDRFIWTAKLSEGGEVKTYTVDTRRITE